MQKNILSKNIQTMIYFFSFLYAQKMCIFMETVILLIQKGSDISKKYLQDRNYGKECSNYSKYINQEYCDFILTKCDKLRCYFLNHIYQNPIQGKYYFKYLSHGKNIYAKFVQTYENDSLNCCLYLFFFK